MRVILCSTTFLLSDERINLIELFHLRIEHNLFIHSSGTFGLFLVFNDYELSCY